MNPNPEKARRSTQFLILLGAISILFAQSERGNISGTIMDPTGGVIPGAKITVTNSATNVSTTITSNEAGAYTAPNLPVGQYNVRAERKASGLQSRQTLP